MTTTLKDIAQRAGVSVSTVSRVLNNDTLKPASKETSDRIWKIILEMNYVPNQTARKLIHRAKDGKEHLAKKSIGCILASDEDSYADPFYSEVLAGIQAETSKLGYVTEYTFTVSWSKDRMIDAALFNNIVSRRVDGAIIMGRIHPELWDLLNGHIPHLVYCGLNTVPRDISQVICDAQKCISLSVDYLSSLGHHRIGYLGTVSSQDKLINEWRYKAYLEAMERHRLLVIPSFIHDTPLSMEGAYQTMCKAIRSEEHATAYVCCNDVSAIGAIRAVQESGLRIPEDISIIGLADISVSSFVNPQLTTIHVYKKALGIHAIQTLVGHIEQEITIHQLVEMPFQLIERKSCGICPCP